MNKKQGLRNLIIVVSFITLMVAYATYSNYEFQKTEPESITTVNEIQKSLISQCGLTIQNIFDGDTVGNNFKINAILSHDKINNGGCQWVAFEAQVGVVRVTDPSGNSIADVALMTTNENWMTTDPVLYNAEVNITDGYTGPALITIDEENASDEQVSKAITFSVVVQ